MSMIERDQGPALSFLRDPVTHGAAPGAVRLIETHGAYVVLAGARAYKMKRAVALPYMDFSTVARRERAVRRELLLNRRIAPGLYREVRPIVRGPDGRPAWGAADDGSAVDALDWVLVMARFPDDALFTRLAEAGRLDDRLLVETAERVAELHRGAEPRPDIGGAAVMARTIAVIEHELRRFAGSVLGPAAVAAVAPRPAERLARLAGLLDRRAASGRLRHGHGDLHLANICLFEGRPTPFDAIEFNDDFVLTDVLYDLAFLLMDLDHRGRRDGASLVLNRYLECTALEGWDDVDALAALPLFLGCRAAIRAYVAATMVGTLAQEGASRERTEAERARAVAYLAHAADYLAPPPARLVAIGGVSGTGKSTLARLIAPALGPAPGALVLRSDVVRKRLFGLDATARLGPEAYRPDVGARVQEALADLAARALAAGHAVVVDQVHGHPAARARMAGVAHAAGVAFDGLWLEAPQPELERRVAGRTGDASDATVAVLRDQLTGIVPPDDWHRLAAGGDPRDLATAACARLDVAWS